MKKNFLLAVIFILLMSFGLTGCVFTEVRDHDEESEEDARERDDEEEEEEEDIEDEFEYYTYSAGSDSLKGTFIIYEYRGDLYFASYYFDCGDGYSETCRLSDAQEETFHQILEAEMVEYQEEEEEEEPRVGAHEVGACVCLNGERMGIYPIDISEAEIPFMDVFDMNIQELENIPFEDMDLIQGTDMWQSNPFFIDYYAYNYMLEQQIERRIGQELVSMTVGEMGEEDYILQAETESGEMLEFTVTIWGYVTE